MTEVEFLTQNRHAEMLGTEHPYIYIQKRIKVYRKFPRKCYHIRLVLSPIETEISYEQLNYAFLINIIFIAFMPLRSN